MGKEETEITLGTGRLLGMFFGLVLLCAVFFATGYKLGRASAPTAATLTDAGSVPPASSPAIKNSASSTLIKPDCAKSPGGCSTPTSNAQPGVVPIADASATSARVAPAAANSTAATAAPQAANTLPAGGYLIQVAAVSKQQDAEALAGALKKKQYQVFIATPATDSLFHVQIGPFENPSDAEAIRSRLISDGYNPILKR